MSESNLISWRCLTGNKYLQKLAPEMLAEEGCVKPQRIRRTGDVSASIFQVIYDREYAMEILIRKVCKPLLPLGKKKALELFNEAWDKAYNSSELMHVQN